MKTIRKVLKSQRVNMGGILLDQPLPQRGLPHIDPFLLVHHWKDDLPGGQNQRELGVGPHPHRGFTPVTFVYEGGVQHQDSLGLKHVVTSGGTQWMFAGKGIIHSERPSKSLSENGGPFEFIQFWINVPAEHKLGTPRYTPLSKEDTPVFKSSEKGIKTGVVTGELNGLKGPIPTHSSMTILRSGWSSDDYKVGSKERTSYDLPKDYDAFIYVVRGKVKVNDTAVEAKDLIWFDKNDQTGIFLEAAEPFDLIVFSGMPIKEPIASYGPFVMNTQAEIADAIEDYQNGKLGNLVEKFD